MDGRSPISCHILDTSVGKPARGVRVKLEGPLPEPSSSTAPAASATTNGVAAAADPPATSASALDVSPPSSATASIKTFESQTDDDGRIKSWLPYSSARASGDVPTYTLEDVLADHQGLPGNSSETRTIWTLRFDVEGYYGKGNTFFPEVAVTFAVQPDQHYHVPLLLAPYSYSTYRGS